MGNKEPADPGSLAEAVAACETAWIAWLFTIPGQIFLLPGHPRRRESAVWNLWIVNRPWPTALASHRLAYRNAWANLRPLWTAHIERQDATWRMKTWSWGEVQTREGWQRAVMAWVADGSWGRLVATYPPCVSPPEDMWRWNPTSVQWVGDREQPRWIDPDLFSDYLEWAQDPEVWSTKEFPQQMLAYVFDTLTVVPSSRWDAWRRWWARH